MATGDFLFSVTPFNYEPPATAYAQIDTRNARPALDFVAGESAVFSPVMPNNYGGNGVILFVEWAATTATTGNGAWSSAFERVAAQQNLDADGFAAAKSSATTAVPAATLSKVSSITHLGSEMDGILPGESFRWKLTRATPTTNASGDLEVFYCWAQEA